MYAHAEIHIDNRTETKRREERENIWDLKALEVYYLDMSNNPNDRHMYIIVKNRRHLMCILLLRVENQTYQSSTNLFCF